MLAHRERVQVVNCEHLVCGHELAVIGGAEAEDWVDFSRVALHWLVIKEFSAFELNHHLFNQAQWSFGGVGLADGELYRTTDSGVVLSVVRLVHEDVAIEVVVVDEGLTELLIELH